MDVTRGSVGKSLVRDIIIVDGGWASLMSIESGNDEIEKMCKSRILRWR